MVASVAERWWKFVGVGLLLAAIWLPRGLALARLVTPDEPAWLTNSANFYRALARRDFANTYQIEHPGVPTMWIGALAYFWRYPAYATDAPRQLEWWVEEVGPFLEAHGKSPLALLAFSRSLMAILISGVLLAAFWAAVRLLGFWPALFGFLLIAFDPFHVAHSRLLHLDGLLSSLILLALLALLSYLLRGHRRRDLVIAGLASGVACLTKSPALFLIPFTALLLLLDETGWRWRLLPRELSGWRRFFTNLLIWGGVALAVGVALWPAMWVQPIQTIYYVMRAMVGHAAKGHEAAIYFNGAVVDGDPGLHFYPVTYLWRTTPLVLIGLGLAALFGTIQKGRVIAAQERQTMLLLALFALLYTLFMSLGAKKWDRYLLPIYLPLDMIAALGWLAAGRALLTWQPRWARPTDVALPLLMVPVVLAIALATLAQLHPYYLSYYNPLLGGTVQAPAVMMIGWGEGLDQAAHYLNSQPDAEAMTVASGIWTGSFSYFFKGHLKGTTFDPATSQVDEWATTDYLVIYINQWQRNRLSPELLAYLATLTPVQSVRLHGLEYVRVYDLRGVPPPDYLLKERKAVELSVQRP